MSHFTHQHKHSLFIGLLVVFTIGILSFFWLFLGQLSQGSIQSVCTQEARLCPNGSATFRTGPYCTFSPCPKDELPKYPGLTEDPFEVPTPPKDTAKKKPLKEGVICTQEVKTCPDGSFVARTGDHCEFAPCPDDQELDVDR